MSVVKNTVAVTATILSSRVTGFIRDMIIAAYVGAGPLNDAFLAAFKLTNLFRSLFAEGAFSASFVPVISKLLKSKGDKYVLAIASHVLFILLFSLIIFSCVFVYNIENIINITNPGFKKNIFIYNLTVELSYIIFPYLALMSLAAFYGALLNSKNIFVPYLATSIILNIILSISPVFTNCLYLKTIVHTLSYGVIVSGILELLWMIFFAWKNKLLALPRTPIINNNIKTIARNILPCILGAGVNQINIWIDMLILSFYQGGISYLYFADRIVQLPLALFSTAAAIVLLPTLSKISQNQSIIFNKTLTMTLFFILPSTFGLLALSKEIIVILFYRGEFTLTSVNGTLTTLNALLIGLPAYGLSKLYVSYFHSISNSKIPLQASLIGLIVNITIALLLLQFIGYRSVAVSSSIAAWANLIYLIIKNNTISLNKSTIVDSVKCFIASIVMCYMLQFINCQSEYHILQLIFKIIMGFICYIGIILILKTQILKDFLNKNNF